MIPAPRTVAGVTTLQVLALLPPVIVVAWPAPFALLQILAVATFTALIWEMVFAGTRKTAFTAHGLTTGLIVALFCPADIALWQLAVAVSLGVIFGELIFGGRGFGFVSAAALSLSLLFVAFPEIALQAPSGAIAIAVLPGLVLLGVAGVVSLSVLGAVGLGTLGMLAGSGEALDLPATGVALSVGAVFLMADPVAASVTRIGRPVYGLLAGALVVVFSSDGVLTPESVVSAALLASVFAPLIDHGAIEVQMLSRRRNG